MLEKLKMMWKKFRVAIVLAIAGVVFAYMVFKKHLGEGFGDYLQDEAKARDLAKKKFEEGSKRIQEEKEKALKAAEEERQKKLKEAEKAAEDKKKELEKKDPEELKGILDKELGVKEKRKGRPKKNV